MRTAVERGAGGALLAWFAPFAATVVLLGTAAFRGESTLWPGAVAVVAALAAAVPVLAGRVARPELSRAGLAAALLLIAFVAWNGISVVWSVLPDRSWAYLNLGLVYLAFGVCGVLVAALVPRAPRAAAAAFAVVLGAVVVWALAGKVFAGLYPDYERVARLRDPVGYWNALALLGDFAVPVALWLAGRHRHAAAVRTAGATLLYAWVVALVLTSSRGGVLVAALVAVGWLALDDERFESFAALVVGGAPGLAVAAIAYRLPGIVRDGQPGSVRAHDGWIFGAVLVGAGAAVAVAAWLLARHAERAPLSGGQRRLLGRVAVGIGAVAVAGALVFAGLRATRYWHEFMSPAPVTQGASHFGSVNANFRTRWWGQAARGFAERPLLGSGAGSFNYWNLRLRTTTIDFAVEPHDLLLQFLAETGIVGFLLAAGAAAAGLLGIWRRLAVERRDRGAALALGLVPVAYLLHGLLDYDWDFVAVTGPAVFAAAVLLAGPGRVLARSILGGVAAAAGAAAIFLSLLMPWLAQRDSLNAWGEPPARELSLARSAHSLDPLLVDAYFQEAEAQYALGNARAAWGRYLDAARAQPDNAETWLRLSTFEWQSLGCPQLAYAHLKRYVALSPQNEIGPFFQQVLAAVNSGTAKC